MVSSALGAVLDALDDPVLVLGTSWQVEHVNDAMRRWMARAGVEVEPLPRSLGELARGLGAATQEMVAVVAAGGQSREKVEVVQIGPRLVWLHTRVTPVGNGVQTARVVVQLRDVTAPLRVEQLLHAKEAVLDASPVALGCADRSGRLVYVNPALQTMLGVAHRSELTGRSLDELFGSEDLARAVMAATGDGKRWEGELHARRLGGVSFAAQVVACPAAAEGRTSGLVVLTFTDLTERVRIEDALGESEATTRILLAANPDPVCLLSSEGEVLALNPAVPHALGRPAEDILGQMVARCLPGISGELLGEHLCRARETGRPVRYEDTIEGRDFDHWIVPVSDGLGGVARLALFSRDITERKAAEAALIATNQMLSALIEASPLPIVALTPQQRVTLWSLAAEQLYGWTEAEAAGLPHPAVPEDGVATYRALLAAVIRGEVKGGVEHSRVCKDGRAVDILVHLAPLFDAAGQVSGAMEIGEDITERKRMQGHLFEAQKMEALGRMAAGFGHDLNNLLQANLGLAQVLRERHGDPARVAQGADELEDLARRGAALLRQLLLFARRVPFKLELLDLNSLVREARELARTMLSESIHVDLDLVSGMLPVEVDREKMLHALTNLAASAAESMPDGGRLRIETSRTEAGVAVAIRDTGKGIGPDELAHLFEPFFSVRGKPVGSGLDLAVAREIVAQAGGTIEVCNLPEGGSAFLVTLPPGDADSLTADEFEQYSTVTDVVGRGERVLIVEDERTAREVFAEVLTDLGYEVLALGSGEEAGSLPTEPRFDVLLADMVLPGASGLDLARGLRDRWPALKIILMSGYSDTQTMGALALIRARYLQKPFDMETLARELRTVLDQR